MVTLTLDSLRARAEAFMQDVSREYYLAHAGLKATAELQPIYDRYGSILGRDALDLTLDLFRSAPAGTDEHRSARLLLDWQVESQVSRALAPYDEREIAWEGSAVVRTAEGRVVPYQRAAIEIANSTDRRERLSLDAARAGLVERELAPLRQERLQREKDLVERLEIAPDYIGTFEALSGIDLRALVGECEQFLRDTEAMWGEVLPAFVKKGLGIPVSEATRADALALLRAREFDAFFPAAELESSVRRQVTEMGIDPQAGGRVVYDTGEREGKRSRAFCAPVRVPEEVYLVLRPHGGQSDYTTLLHELGHALHFALMRADYPFEYRWVGDNSITESYAMLFDHRMQDPGWLKRYTGLGSSNVPRFLRAAGFEELHFLRRYSAKLIYEVQLYGGEVSWRALPDVYVDTLSAATTFRYHPADAFVDVDPRFYSARYLRAWQLQAVLAEVLTERFDEDWYRNPKAGPWMVEQLFAEAQRELATELAERVAQRQLSFAPLVRSIERLLA
jgi:hypothetical protein